MAIGWDEDWHKTGENIRAMREEALRAREEMEYRLRQEQMKFQEMEAQMEAQMQIEKLKVQAELDRMRYDMQPSFPDLTQEQLKQLKMAMGMEVETKPKTQEHFDEEDFTID